MRGVRNATCHKPKSNGLSVQQMLQNPSNRKSTTRENMSVIPVDGCACYASTFLIPS